MDKITQLLDDQDVSLDEVLAFIDSSDFDLAANDGQDAQVEASGIFDSMDIEDALTADNALALPDHDMVQQIQTVVKSTPQVQDVSGSDIYSGEVGSRVPSHQLKLSMVPYKERGRVRDRVIRLRGMAKQLEWQLEDLNAIKFHSESQRGDSAQSEENKASAVNGAAPAPIVHGSGDVVTWHQLAIRQYAARRAAEKENMSLKEHLEEHIRVAKRLEHLIRGQLPNEILLELRAEHGDNAAESVDARAAKVFML